MNRTSFLFLALLIASCLLTVNSRHEARTLITEKAVLSDKMHALEEDVRRLNLDKARLEAKAKEDEEPEECIMPAPAKPVVKPVAPAASTAQSKKH